MTNSKFSGVVFPAVSYWKDQSSNYYTDLCTDMTRTAGEQQLLTVATPEDTAPKSTGGKRSCKPIPGDPQCTTLPGTQGPDLPAGTRTTNLGPRFLRLLLCECVSRGSARCKVPSASTQRLWSGLQWAMNKVFSFPPPVPENSQANPSHFPLEAYFTQV